MSVPITLTFEYDGEVEVEAVATEFYSAEPDTGLMFGGVEGFDLYWPNGTEWTEQQYERLTDDHTTHIIQALEDAAEYEPDVD